MPGAEIAVLAGDLRRAGSLYAIRIRLRDAFVTPPHWHPQDEHITVLHGTLSLGLRTQVRSTEAARASTGDPYRRPEKKATLQPIPGHDPPRGPRLRTVQHDLREPRGGSDQKGRRFEAILNTCWERSVVSGSWELRRATTLNQGSKLPPGREIEYLPARTKCEECL